MALLAHGVAYRKKKKNQEEKAHSATFCCRSRRLCLGGYRGDLREKRALSQRREERRNVCGGVWVRKEKREKRELKITSVKSVQSLSCTWDEIG